MIINGFGGGVAEALGFKVVQPGTVLYNNGFTSGFSIGDTATTVTPYQGNPSGTWLVPKAYGITAAVIKQPIYLVPLRGKYIQIDWFSAYDSSDTTHRLAFAVTPYNTAHCWAPLNSSAGVQTSFQSGPCIGTPINPANGTAYQVYTASILITDDMIFGYICMVAAINTTTDRGYIGCNNIRISS